jgi:uncharacterized membrane-anchored protein YitT (DUF2179 family)
MKQNILRFIKELSLITAGSILYAASTVLFIFPHSLLLGGTSGVSVILQSFIPFSAGSILMIINFSLIILAFLILGKGMALKTLIGSTLTTLLIGIFEKLFVSLPFLIVSPYLSSLTGAAIIAVASGIMFYIDSSSGGTDIIALIVQKFSSIRIGRALLITDILIVLTGGLLSGFPILAASFLGLIVKTFGIDFVIAQISKLYRS